MSPHVRTVKTASGARAVQIVHSTRAGKRDIEHIGSAHDEQQLELLKAVARQRMHAGQGELDLDLAPAGAAGQPLAIKGTRLAALWDALARGYEVLGFGVAAGWDEVFRLLVLARIIEPTSKLDAARVLAEAGVGAPSYPTIKRHLPGYAIDEFREAIAAKCADHAGVGSATLLLYDVTTLYFETDKADGFREPGFSNYAEVAVMPRSPSRGRCSRWSAGWMGWSARHNAGGGDGCVPVWWCSRWPARRRTHGPAMHRRSAARGFGSD